MDEQRLEPINNARASSSNARSSVVKAVPLLDVRFPPPKSALRNLRPVMRALGTPVLGRPVHSFLTRFAARNCPSITVRSLSSPFFFPDGREGGALWRTSKTGPVTGVATGFGGSGVVGGVGKSSLRSFLNGAFWKRMFRPSRKHDRGYAMYATSTDMGAAKGGVQAATTAAPFNVEANDRIAEQDATYYKHFGFEGHFEGALRGATMVCLSPIHGRGLFATVDLPAGALLICPREVNIADAAAFALLSGDKPDRAAAYSHYMHHEGGGFLLPLTPQPMHLVNHSCEGNLRGGFYYDVAAHGGVYARARDEIALDDGGSITVFTEPPLDEAIAAASKGTLRVDPFAFVTSRAVKKGEELTLDYATMIAPSFPGQLRNSAYTVSTVVDGATLSYQCECGSRHCRGCLDFGIEQWSMTYLSHSSRRAAMNKVLFAGTLEEGTTVGGDALVRASMLLDRSELFGLLYGPLCNPIAKMVSKREVVLQADATVGYLNTIRAERDCRGDALVLRKSKQQKKQQQAT